MMESADRFIAWVAAELKRLPPGTCLAGERVLGAQWGLSARTVGRLLQTMEAAGEVVRVRGKGTFLGAVPVSTGPSEAAITPRRSSAENLAREVTKLIAGGQVKTGDALPSIKRASLTFHVTPKTVITAYRKLGAAGLVTRIGKRRIVGSSAEILRSSHGREIVLINTVEHFLGGSFKAVFNWDRMAPAYVRLEHELCQHGFRLIYRQYSQLPELERQWDKKHPAAGVLFAPVTSGTYKEVIGSAVRIRESSPPRWKPSVVVLTQSGNRPPEGIHQFCFGNFGTVHMREMAAFTVRQKLKKVVIFRNKDHSASASMARPLRLFTELLAQNPGIELSVVVIARNPADPELTLMGDSPDDYLRRVHASESRACMQAFIMSSLIRTPKDFSFGEHLNADGWLFLDSSFAAQGLDYCSEAGVPVPAKLSIVSAEDGTDFLSKAITVCAVDWQTIGYKIAHALIGDIPLDRTTRGFVRPAAIVLERGTTRHI